MNEVQLTTGGDEHLNHVLEWYTRGWPNTCAAQGEIKCYIKKENESSYRKRISRAYTIKTEILISVLPARTILIAMD